MPPHGSINRRTELARGPSGASREGADAVNRDSRRKIRNWIVGLLGAWFVRLWISTVRVRLVGYRFDGRVALPPASGIYVLWHQRLFTPAAYFQRSGFRTVISKHSDGEMLARVLKRLGTNPVRGSTTRGGANVVRELLREDVDRSRLFMVLTADGPKGPARRFQAGAIYLASKTGLPIYSNAITMKRSWLLPSWDKFLLPKPFTKAVIRTVGEPFHVPPDLDREAIEEYRLQMEQTLEDFTQDTDKRFDEIYAAARAGRQLAPFEERKVEAPELARVGAAVREL